MATSQTAARFAGVVGLMLWALAPPGVARGAGPAGPAAAGARDACYAHGDVNGDGVVSSGDALIAFLIGLGMHTPTEAEGCAADCNGNGVISTGDAQDIFLEALGAGVCPHDLPNGQSCLVGGDCASLHCQSNLCCAGGDCCLTVAGCPPDHSPPPVCDSPATCQGTRTEASCLDYRCGSTAPIADDSACDAAVLASECGLYLPLYCTGSPEQTPPLCPDGCTSDGDCDPEASCLHDECCIPDVAVACGPDDDVWSFDSCGNAGSLIENCADEPHGTCVAGACRCLYGWTGPDCAECSPGWVGPDCDTCVFRVDIDATAPQPDGLSWATAFTTVQPAVDAAYAVVSAPDGPPGCEVWVAEGVYSIYRTARTDTLTLREDVSVYGGFAGNENARDERDWRLHETALDGLDQSYHVVLGADDSHIDGFTITRGRANGAAYVHDAGGGLRNFYQSTSVANCRFIANRAINGGAIHAVVAAAMVDSCEFRDNVGFTFGGAIHSTTATTTVTNSLFVNNSADYGAVFANSGAVATITNCTFVENVPEYSASVAYNWDGSRIELRNSLFWGHPVSPFVNIGIARTTVSYSASDQGLAGDGNVDLYDPVFVGADDFHLLAGAPCIDAANGTVAPPFDAEGRARCDDPAVTNTGVGSPDYVDMGAYERCE